MTRNKPKCTCLNSFGSRIIKNILIALVDFSELGNIWNSFDHYEPRKICLIKLIFVPRKVCIWSTPKVLHIVFSNANAFGSKSRSPGCAFKPFLYSPGCAFPPFCICKCIWFKIQITWVCLSPSTTVAGPPESPWQASTPDEQICCRRK